MEFVENEEDSVTHATSEQLKPSNVNRYSNDSGVVDIDLRPLEVAEIHRLSAAGNGQSQQANPIYNSISGTGMFFSVCYMFRMTCFKIF